MLLSKYNIALIVCDNEHLPTGIYHSQNGHFRAYKKITGAIIVDAGAKKINYGK